MEQPINFTSCIYGRRSGLSSHVQIYANEKYEYYFKARHDDEEEKKAITVTISKPYGEEEYTLKVHYIDTEVDFILDWRNRVEESLSYAHMYAEGYVDKFAKDMHKWSYSEILDKYEKKKSEADEH